MNSNPLLEHIKKQIDLTEKEENLLLSKIIFKNLLKDQYVGKHGDVCNSIYFITSGCTKTFYQDKKGQEHIVAFSVEDWWTGDLGSFISQTPADYNVQCLEKTAVIQFNYKELQILFEQIPKLERFFRKLLERAYVASQKRIIRNFSLSAKERYLIFKDSYLKIEQRVPQYLVASYLGITKEFLSKIKSQLVKTN